LFRYYKTIKNIESLIVVSIALSFVTHAEEGLESSTQLDEISIVEEVETENHKVHSSEAYESFDPVDTGLSVLSADAIGASHQGGMDTSELLNVLPFVQLDVERNEGSAESEQHMRPSDISISGGQFYENNIMIDGVSVNSLMNVTQDEDTEHYDEVNGQTSQTFYVDPMLLEAVAVQDSNVSAQYGNFSGGAVDYQIREPGDEFHARISVGMQKDEMIYYIGEDLSYDPYPDFMKYKTSISFDLPLTEKLKVLLAYSRSESQSYYTLDEDYGGYEYTNGDISETFTLKSTYDFHDSLSSTFMLSTSPYESEYTSDDDFDSVRISQSSGLISYLSLNGYTDDYDWTGKLSYNESDASRDWDGDRYKWDTDSDYGSTLCDGSYCYEGGFGDIEQIQQDYTLALSATTEIGDGILSVGSESIYSRAYKSRLESNTFYNKYVLDEDDGIVCAPHDDACMSDIAFTSAIIYDAYAAEVSIFSQTLWTEYQHDFDSVTLRGGLRYEYENYLDNHNIAPRLSGTWEFTPDYFVTAGLNRYYGRNMLAHAMKSATPATTTNTRDLNSDGTLSGWEYSTSGTDYDYSQSNLNTPYSDELSLVFTVPTMLDGNFRIKGIMRQHRDGFSTLSEYDADQGYLYTLGNNGATDYQGIAFEWSGRVENHAFTANIAWSETRKVGGTTSYMSETDIDDLRNNDIYYDGQVMSEYDMYLLEDPENFGTPLRASISWSATWWQEKLQTLATVRYRGEYNKIDETNTTVEVDGQDYEVYEKDAVNAYTEVNLNARMEIFRTEQAKGNVDVRMTNIFNTDPYSESSSYRRGRAFWVDLSIDM